MKFQITLFSVCLYCALSTISRGIDLNGNSMSDVWEARFNARNLTSTGDEDGDGVTNFNESIAGTDPFSATSVFRIREIRVDETTVNLSVPTLLGKSYKLFSSSSPTGPWVRVSSVNITATGGNVDVLVTAIPSDRSFYRVSVEDVDADNDGVFSWEERQLSGFSVSKGDSFNVGTANNDLTLVENYLNQLNLSGFEITSPHSEIISDPAADLISHAYELGTVNASFTLTRQAPLTAPFVVFVKQLPASSSNISIPQNNEFRFRTAAGEDIFDRIIIPAGQASIDIVVEPIADTLLEVPEELRYSIGGSAKQIKANINDAAPTIENQKLLFAYLTPRQGVNSLGSGLATMKLAGDHSSALITVAFSNLTSVTNSVQVEAANNVNLFSIPPFKYNGYDWKVKANQFYITDQSALDALLNGSFTLNVYTTQYSSGEISGAFTQTAGSSLFAPPAEPAPITTLSGDDLDREVARFLTQSTFGPTKADIDAMKARIGSKNGNRITAYNEWIDEQLALSYSSHKEIAAAVTRLEKFISPSISLHQRPRQHAWWTIVLQSPAQLRERMAYALSQIMVISDKEPTIRRMSPSMANFYEILQKNSSLSFETLLRDVTLDPNMGQYLSSLRNQKEIVSGQTVISPDENFAREIMQLFSIGLVSLHPDSSVILGTNGFPIPTYDQNDISELARVFTGLSFSKRASGAGSQIAVDNNNFNLASSFEEFGIRWSHPMKMFDEFHDQNAKSIMNLEIPARANGGMQDINETVNYLANHPNTAPFISRQLIQRFTSSNPSRGYIYRVANEFKNSGGDFKRIIKAILLDPEARNLSLAHNGIGSGKPKENLLRHNAILRAFQAQSGIPLNVLDSFPTQNFGWPATEKAKLPTNATLFRYNDTDQDLAQSTLSAPSVFNFYRPDYSPGGALAENGLSSPEFQIINETSIVKAINYHYNPIYETNGQGTTNMTLSGYNTTSDNVKIDIAPLRDLYLSVLDTNGNGSFTNTDTGTWNNITKIEEAVALVVDRIDLLLCAGSLKARYGNIANEPRSIIIKAVTSVRSGQNGTSSVSTQNTSMDERIRTAIYLVVKSPDFIIQK